MTLKLHPGHSSVLTNHILTMNCLAPDRPVPAAWAAGSGETTESTPPFSHRSGQQPPGSHALQFSPVSSPGVRGG